MVCRFFSGPSKIPPQGSAADAKLARCGCAVAVVGCHDLLHRFGDDIIQRLVCPDLWKGRQRIAQKPFLGQLRAGSHRSRSRNRDIRLVRTFPAYRRYAGHDYGRRKIQDHGVLEIYHSPVLYPPAGPDDRCGTLFPHVKRRVKLYEQQI